MCYFLYGSVNSEINIDDYKKATKNSKYHFNIGSKDDVNACVQNCGVEYRITATQCDCDTPIGSKQANKERINEISELLTNLKISEESSILRSVKTGVMNQMKKN